jgi:hypothetical protein
MPLTWKGARTRLLLKKYQVTQLTNWQPVCLLRTAYKVASAVINDRLTHLFEQFDILERQQEGNQKQHNTILQVYLLLQIIEDAKRTGSTLYVLYLDLVNAYNATNLRALFQTLENYGVPQQDVEMLRSLHQDSWLRVSNNYGETTRCRLDRGVKQGDVTSPLLFAALINLLLRSLQHTGCGYNLTPPVGDTRRVQISNGAFVDDTYLATNTAGSMQTLVDRVADFSIWTGIDVHIQKSEITAYDYKRKCPLATDSIQYRGHPFTRLEPEHPFRLLGVRITLTSDWRYEKAHIWSSMMDRLTHLKAAVVDPRHAAEALRLGVVSVFRYSAAVVPWTTTELERISRLWAAGMRYAWRLPPTCANGIPCFTRAMGGQQTPSAHEVHLQSLITAWVANCLHADDGRILAEQDRLRTLQKHNCLNLHQLQARLRLSPFTATTTMLERIVAASDCIGLDVQDAHTSLSEGHGLSAVLHPVLRTVSEDFLQYRDRWTAATRRRIGPASSEPIRGIPVEDAADDRARAGWDKFRKLQQCLSWLGVRGIYTVEQLLAARGASWIPRSAWLPGHRPPTNGYRQLLAVLTELVPLP